LVVHADSTQLHQVIVNLATNAKQAMADGSGVLTVCVEPWFFDENSGENSHNPAPGKYARISVSDTGVGIPEENLDKIFEPYFTTKEKGTGTGLGLSVVHGIVKAHNGHIAVQSEPRKGTTFCIDLPIAQKAPVSIPDHDAEPLPKGSERILLVDDESPIVKMQQQNLERMGYSVTTNTNSIKALEAFRAHPDKFDLVITDMTMPNMTGDTLAHEVKTIRRDVPVILCTGFSEKLDGHGKGLAIDGFLMKPVDKMEMAKAIRKVLDEAKTRVP
jgi:CheY-like chemotaxis protein